MRVTLTHNELCGVGICLEEMLICVLTFPVPWLRPIISQAVNDPMSRTFQWWLIKNEPSFIYQVFT